MFFHGRQYMTKLIFYLLSVLLFVWSSLVCDEQIRHANMAHEGVAVEEPVDIVYTWVDGADPRWQVIRRYWQTEYMHYLTNSDSISSCRYKNRDELKYSLRSVYQFAPFVRHIYIITFNQVPAWLQSDPRITIVDHSVIFRNTEDLPTFNSQAIECNLHRIPGLSERFIYLNDDVFFGSEVTVDDFFTKDGGIIVTLSKHLAARGKNTGLESTYESAWKNATALLNSNFKKERRFRMAHAPFAFTKTLFKEVENYFFYIFDLVISHKFRLPSDFPVINGVIQYYAFYTKRAEFGQAAAGQVRITDDVVKNEEALKAFEGTPWKFFCVQDVTESDDPVIDVQVKEFFEFLYPNPAPWERRTD